jgi:hypothetical protein
MFVIGTDQPSRHFGPERQSLVWVETEKKASARLEKTETESRRNIAPVVETSDSRTKLDLLRTHLCGGQKKTNTCQQHSRQVFPP